MPLILAMISFSFAMSISPGPVNMVIVSSGANYGIKRTFPFVSGASIGFTIQLIFVGFGFYQFIQTYPYFLKYLAVAGSLFIIYMGYKILSSKPELELQKQKAPKFYEGFLMQWLNPKAWIACVSGVSLFSNPESHKPLILFVAIYFLVCYGSLAAWSIIGDKVTILLNSKKRIRFFNIVMGILLILTATYLVYSQIYQ